MGVFLSGGIDSSAIAAIAARDGRSVRTLSIGFDESESDETQYAEAVARAIGSEHQTVVITGDEMMRDLDLAISGLDLPTFDGVNTWFISRSAVRAGLKVALAGTGGDELLGGYTSFRRLPKLMRWARFVRWSSTFSSRIPKKIVGGDYSSRAKLADLPSTRGCPVRLYQTQYAMFPASTTASFVDADPHGLDAWGLEPQRLEHLQEMTALLSPLRAISLLESELYLGDRLLRDTDAVSMDHSLEVRLPLVDTTLSDRIAGMPDDLRYHPLGTKPLLRSIAEGAAGAKLFNRPKRGFEFPFDRWMRGALRPEIASVLFDTAACVAIGLRPQAASALWHAFLERPGSVYWTRVWALFVLLKWCTTVGLTRVE